MRTVRGKKMFEVMFNKHAFEDGYHFRLFFMHGDADYNTEVTYHIEDELAARDFYEMLIEIYHTRGVPKNHLYWLKFEDCEYEDIEEWSGEWGYDGSEREELAHAILDAEIPLEKRNYLSEDLIEKVNFTIPFDDLEYTYCLASLIGVEVMYAKDGVVYPVKTDFNRKFY